MPIRLGDIAIPDFGLPVEVPQIPPATYEQRCSAAYQAAGADWFVIYADREHFANIMFLTGFDPRFEEALLVLGPRQSRIIIVGNECLDYARLARLPGVEILLAQSFALMGQDRSQAPSLAHVLREVGMKTGDSVALAGWKYLEPAEWNGSFPAFFVPSFIVDVLREIAGKRVSDATPVLMHPITGLRSVVDADQIAVSEWAGARASAALWRILSGVKEGDTEYGAVARMQHEGEPLSAHLMLASGDASSSIIGLRSPGTRVMKRGDGIVGAIGLWGGLSARGGLLSDRGDDFLKIASAYFEGLLAWYEAADIGICGGDIFSAVTEVLARGGLRSALNPGHLTSYDEWVHSPIQPGYAGKISAGMAFQVDIIPVPMRMGHALNCEDPVVFADQALRRDLEARHPAVAQRIAERRIFVRDAIGIDLKESILPMSSTPLCLPPFWLKPNRLLTRN